MADLHHHHDETSSTTVVSEGYDGEGPATALIVVLILAFVGFLIWLVAFSGIVFGHNGSSTTNNNVRIQQPMQQPANPGNTNTNTNPAPTTSQ